MLPSLMGIFITIASIISISAPPLFQRSCWDVETVTCVSGLNWTCPLYLFQGWRKNDNYLTYPLADYKQGNLSQQNSLWSLNNGWLEHLAFKLQFKDLWCSMDFSYLICEKQLRKANVATWCLQKVCQRDAVLSTSSAGWHFCESVHRNLKWQEGEHHRPRAWYKPASTEEVKISVSLLQPRPSTPPIFTWGQCSLPSSDLRNLRSRWSPLALCFFTEKRNEEIFAECSSQKLKLFCLGTPARKRQPKNFRAARSHRRPQNHRLWRGFWESSCSILLLRQDHLTHIVHIHMFF